ncbi:hypothetical protein [Methanobacterium spitsbergense]|uniref:Uncharacterized protein n=1 Tax=Methanobacterium spitsbergense TaxID=2874285 RepID=A0A8T5V234_9EURY|nr:hypothetical protein [Methanobacterium spitsbergense]MBZ2167009.1 hypothetical protein [Methanobacterium spitsbergense]
MYDLETVKATFKTKLKDLTDPWDISEDPKPIIVNLTRGEPDLISLQDGVLAGLVFMGGMEQPLGLNKRGPINAVISKPKRQVWQSDITGAVVLFVPGNDDDADTVATHLSDVVSDFFKDPDCLGLPGVIVTPLITGNSMNWRPLTISLENTKKPIKSLTAAIKFSITIDDNKKH